MISKLEDLNYLMLEMYLDLVVQSMSFWWSIVLQHDKPFVLIMEPYFDTSNIWSTIRFFGLETCKKYELLVLQHDFAI